MTPEEFEAKMIEISNNYDEEMAHRYADWLMCDLLQELGYGDGADVFEAMPKGYA